MTILFLLALSEQLSAQFSPGELSSAHKELEGSTNCTKCHEVGREISGTKCLACHEAINAELQLRKGYHFNVSSSVCVTCHKEHLGATAKTTRFEPRSFDHTLTGYALSGKHANLECRSCHAEKNIRNGIVRRTITDHPHETFLGLTSTCGSCHEDPHHGKFKQECSSCHSPASWTTVEKFNHGTTRFPLDGKHASVACVKCHAAVTANRAPGGTDFTTKPFTDCTPCHSSLHKMSTEDRSCRSCHSTDGWHAASAKPFDHNRTAYPLVGKHRDVACEKCHQTNQSGDFKRAFLRPFGKCTDCHADKHHGEFQETYQNDCSRCHTEQGYTPSTFSLSKHNTGSFALTGGHRAVACDNCHRNATSKSLVFHFNPLSCETCHRDVHRGQFADLMKEASCSRCHSTNGWKDGTYDHATTGFPLAGKHATIACADCHKEVQQGTTVRFTKLQTDCASCHQDKHAGQFASDGKTDCTRCHSPQLWTTLIFNHQAQSSFSLSGAHERVSCKSCHHEESSNGSTIVRYKPLSGKCESCHSQEIRR